MFEKEKKQKNLKQAFKELLRGYDVIGNLKFIIIAFFGFFGIRK